MQKASLFRKLRLRLFQIIALAIVATTVCSVIGYTPKTVTGIEPPTVNVIKPALPTPESTDNTDSTTSDTPKLILLPLAEPDSAVLIPLKVSGSVRPAATSSTVNPSATDYDSYGFTLQIREMMAKTLGKEADRLYVGDTEASKVVWSMLNRLDSGILWFGSDMAEILTKESQYAYDENTPVTEENLELVNDVIDRWIAEKNGGANVGRTLPKDFYAFYGDGTTNLFWKWSSGGLGQPGDTKEYYDGSLGTPYAI